MTGLRENDKKIALEKRSVVGNNDNFCLLVDRNRSTQEGVSISAQLRGHGATRNRGEWNS